MADLSFTINISDLDSKIAGNSAVAGLASSRIADSSAGWDAGAAAGAKADAASSAINTRSAAWDEGLNSSEASDLASSIAVSQVAAASALLSATAVSRAAKASSAAATKADSKVTVLASSVIKTDPGVGSRRVQRLIYTSKASMKWWVSSNAITE